LVLTTQSINSTLRNRWNFGDADRLEDFRKLLPGDVAVFVVVVEGAEGEQIGGGGGYVGEQVGSFVRGGEGNGTRARASPEAANFADFEVGFLMGPGLIKG